MKDMRWAAILLIVMPWQSVWSQATRRPARPAAAPQQAAPTSWPLESIDIQGNQFYSREEILAVAGLKIGQLAEKKDFEAARQRLIDSGAFASVGLQFGPSADKKGYAATFELTEIEQVYPYRFEDLQAPNEELRALLKKSYPLFQDKIPVTTEVLGAASQIIDKYLADKGVHLPAKVKGEMVADTPGQFVILFRPAIPRPTIYQVRFVNNKVLPPALLHNTMANVAIGIPYSEPMLRQLLDTSVRPLYEARGRIRVSFPKISVEPARDNDGLVVTVEVDEGPSFKLGQVHIAPTVYSEDDLLTIGKWKTGDLADFDLIRAGQDRILKRFHRDGYMRATSRIERTIHDKELTVDVTVHITPGPQFLFGKLTVKGLDLTSEPAVRKMWGIQPGKPFDADYPDYFLQRVREEGIFDNLGKTEAQIEVHDATKTADVTLVFHGAPPQPEKKRGPGY